MWLYLCSLLLNSLPRLTPAKYKHDEGILSPSGNDVASTISSHSCDDVANSLNNLEEFSDSVQMLRMKNMHIVVTCI